MKRTNGLVSWLCGTLLSSLLLSAPISVASQDKVYQPVVDLIKQAAKDNNRVLGLRGINFIPQQFCAALDQLLSEGDTTAWVNLMSQQSLVWEERGFVIPKCSTASSAVNEPSRGESKKSSGSAKRYDIPVSKSEQSFIDRIKAAAKRGADQLGPVVTPRNYCIALEQLLNEGETTAWVHLSSRRSVLIEESPNLWKLGSACSSYLGNSDVWITETGNDRLLELKINPAELEKRPTKYQTGIESVWVEETYNIDLLKIETRVRSLGCSEGSEVWMTLTGMIGPDSSFAMDKLLEQLSPCRDSDGNLIKQVKLNISSGGGLLNDGYKLGRTLKKYNVRAVIKNDTSCASSCAVAFLGAANRVVEDKGQIMFHAPYFSGKNEYGERDIDCDVGEKALTELNDYYISMTDTETGDRLFERTMWYCSANDGWVVTGGAAAELFGIATER